MGLGCSGYRLRLTQPDQSTQVFDGVDVEVDPLALEQPVEEPATSDPEQSTDDTAMGGTGGENAGGAG